MWGLMREPKVMRLSKELVEEFYNMEKVPRDRPESKNRLDIYRAILAKNRFRSVHWVKAFCKETGKVYRINGKHTSILMWEVINNLPVLWAFVEEFHCDTLEDMAELYSTFDSRTQSRTVTDINGTFAGCSPALTSVSPRILSLGVSGICFSRDFQNYGTVPANERAKVMLNHPDFFLWLEKVFEKEKSRQESGMYRVPVTAAMFQCFKLDRERADKFWLEVRDEEGHPNDVPSRHLATYLRNRVLRSSATKKKKHTATGQEMYDESIRSWNAWRKGRATVSAYRSVETPVAI
jgi:hypothetical protein